MVLNFTSNKRLLDEVGMSKKIKHHTWCGKDAGDWYEKLVGPNGMGTERVLILRFDSSIHSDYRLIRTIDTNGELKHFNIPSRDFFWWKRLTGD